MKVNVMRNLMQSNDQFAQKTRELMADRKIKLFNLIGSPGTGKTSVLEAVLPVLKKKGYRCAVVEGDCHTSRDAERIAALEVEVVQINTGDGCHLDANVVSKGIGELNLEGVDFIFVENVGNMVCPAEFDIGELAKIAISSTTEGDDKPIKYPRLFLESKLVVLNKMDLIPHTNFNLRDYKGYVAQIQANLPIIEISATNLESVIPFVDWLEKSNIQNRQTPIE